MCVRSTCSKRISGARELHMNNDVCTVTREIFEIEVECRQSSPRPIIYSLHYFAPHHYWVLTYCSNSVRMVDGPLCVRQNNKVSKKIKNIRNRTFYGKHRNAIIIIYMAAVPLQYIFINAYDFVVSSRAKTFFVLGDANKIQSHKYSTGSPINTIKHVVIPIITRLSSSRSVWKSSPKRVSEKIHFFRRGIVFRLTLQNRRPNV